MAEETVEQNAQSVDISSLDVVMDVKVTLTVQLGASELPMKEVMELTPGAVVQLQQQSKDPVGLLVNGKLIGYGEVVVVNDNFGIKITEILGSGN